MPEKAITQDDLQQALYIVLDNYDYKITFKPGLKTLAKISGAVAIGNIISLFAMKYAADGLKKLAERIEWETIKKNYHKSQGEENGLSGSS